MKGLNVIFGILFVLVNFVTFLITLVGVGLTEGSIFWELVGIVIIPPNFFLLIIYFILMKLLREKESINIEIETDYDSKRIKGLNIYLGIILAVVNAVCFPKFFTMLSMEEWFFALVIIVVPNVLGVVVYKILHFIFSKKVKFL